MRYETLLYGKDDRVAVITLNRPERRNAFDYAMVEQAMLRALEKRAPNWARCEGSRAA